MPLWDPSPVGYSLFFLVRRTQADTDGRVLDAENLAKGTIEIAGIGLGHAIGVTDEEHEGRRGHFRLREI